MSGANALLRSAPGALLEALRSTASAHHNAELNLLSQVAGAYTVSLAFTKQVTKRIQQPGSSRMTHGRILFQNTAYSARYSTSQGDTMQQFGGIVNFDQIPKS